jgi:DNA-binding helix-hairpin-helix protein with protein kinase domain
VSTRPFPEPGDVVRMVRGGSTVTVTARVAQGGQGVVFRGTGAGRDVAVKWYRATAFLDRQRRDIAALAGHSRPHPVFAWPIDLVEGEGIGSFGYVMPWIREGFVSLAQVLQAERQPPFRVLIAIGRELADALASLHGRGLCYRDISFGNLLVDPSDGTVAIVDNDNVGPDGGDSPVRGTLRFMAPEVLRGEAPPSTVTDLYSLSVFLFFLLVHGHPLEGGRTHAAATWAEGEPSETALALRFFGEEPLFVFDPDDRSNAPDVGDPMLRWWPIYPRFLRDLFVRAFGTGLRDASLAGRVTEGEWRRALLRLDDCLHVCGCRASVFWDPDDPTVPCWNCGRVPPLPPLLRLPGSTVVLSPGAVVTRRHLCRDLDYRSPQALVEVHPGDAARVVLRNVSDLTWALDAPGEGPKAVRPGQRLAVRPMVISFGPATGTITAQLAGS